MATADNSKPATEADRDKRKTRTWFEKSLVYGYLPLLTTYTPYLLSLFSLNFSFAALRKKKSWMTSSCDDDDDDDDVVVVASVPRKDYEAHAREDRKVPAEGKRFWLVY